MSRGYDPVSIGLHWVFAALFFGQIALGFTMERVKSMVLQFELIQWHKSFGFLILGLAVLRLAWRVARGRLPVPEGLSAGDRRAATLVQYTLLALTIAVPLAGWALASSSTLQIPSFVFNLFVMPHLPLDPSAQAEAFWRQAHGWLAYATLALALGHAAAALRHHFLLHDAVLIRMLPRFSGEAGTRSTRRTNDRA
jgi:cytochrome b561